MEKVKLIRGSEEREEEIRKTLEEWGGINKDGFNFSNKSKYYYVDSLSYINLVDYTECDKCVAKGKAEIYELPPLQTKCALKPFDNVLVRDYNYKEWRCDLFSHKLKNGEYSCIGRSWNYCIPYEGNEALLGTTDNPK